MFYENDKQESNKKIKPMQKSVIFAILFCSCRAEDKNKEKQDRKNEIFWREQPCIFCEEHAVFCP